jgi:hypothetical protein
MIHFLPNSYQKLSFEYGFNVALTENNQLFTIDVDFVIAGILTEYNRITNLHINRTKLAAVKNRPLPTAMTSP